MMYLAPLTVAPGRATREVGSRIWGSDTSGRTKLDVLIFMCCNVDLCMY